MCIVIDIAEYMNLACTFENSFYPGVRIILFIDVKNQIII